MRLDQGSKRRLFDFFDSIPAAIFRTTLEGKIVYCNQAFADIFGFRSARDLIDYAVIELYQNKKDRGMLINSVLRWGRLADLPVALKKRDGKPIWGAVTAKAVLDDDGIVVNLDGVIRDITDEVEVRETHFKLPESAEQATDIILIITLKGEIIDINEPGAEILGIPKHSLFGRSLMGFISPADRELFLIFLSDVLKLGRNETILSIVDADNQAHHIEWNAARVKKNGRVGHIQCRGRDVTQIIDRRRKRSNDEKFEGVLQMAGGVAHRLNQPLTIINNLIGEVLDDLQANGRVYRKIVDVQGQVDRLNEITQKISNIKKYEVMDYVAGVRIVDIDRAS